MPRPSSRRWLLLVALAPLLFGVRPLADAPPVVVTHEGAYIAHDPASDLWSIGNHDVELVVGFDASKALTVQRLWDPTTEHELDINQAPDASVTLAGQLLPFSASNGVLSFTGATMEETDNGVRLVFNFEHRTLHTLVRRIYVCYPGTPTFETWTELEAPSQAASVQVSDLAAWQFTMPAATLRWVTGLRGDNASELVPDSFSVGGGDLDDGDETDIGSQRRSSEGFVPIVFVDNGTDEFYGGVMWSGAWKIAMQRGGDRLSVSASFPGTVTSLTSAHPIEFPHAFFGFMTHSTTSESAALRQFVLRGVRGGRPFRPLVTYNTWFSYGAAVTEDDLDHEMARAASLGVELFVLDAGWYTGAGVNGAGDFTSGLGSWQIDPDRFPDQLQHMAGQAHAYGMQFGLWVEPERVALSTVNQPGLARESWLATHDGSYGTTDGSAQVCFASAAARQWVYQRVVDLIDQVQPDYLKWDNNFWTNCNRDGHDHGHDDGNFSHVQGLYSVLAQLRERYPAMIIENVSGGGNRLDYGMVAYTDTAWMDDLTAPSAHVRHNLEGLSAVFPPAYLLSFAINSGDEPFAGVDLAQVIRSRMPGILGLTYRSDDLDADPNNDVSAALAAQIAQYKLLRDGIAESSASLLSTQIQVDDSGWDVIQEVSDHRRDVIVFAFKSDDDAGRVLVKPLNLSPATTYLVRSVDNGSMGSARGDELMQDGVELVHATGESRAHLITFTAQ